MTKWIRPLLQGLVLATAAAATPAVGAKALVPVVFAPGMGVPAEFTAWFRPLYSFFSERGYRLHVALTPRGGTLEARSEKLMSEIDRFLPNGESFHLIGHSMGGLDSRRAIQRYALGDRVLSLTTISTPHRGSPLADELMEDADGEPSSNPILAALESQFSELGDAGGALTTAAMAEFNARTPDDPRVAYFSMGFYIPEPVQLHTISLLDWYAFHVIKKRGAPHNDGMVDVDSARWGTDLGAFPGSHMSQTKPIPYDGRLIYEKTFDRVLKNLDRCFR
jgi:triacylglycerol lipase